MLVANQKVSVMAEVFFTSNAEAKVQRPEQPVASRPSSLARSLTFKYYIHDSVSTLRFQLIGDLRSANVHELNGSWDTARTTLGSRQFLIDVKQLFGTDDEGHAWLHKMKQSGAKFLPENYVDSRAEQSTPGLQDQAASVKLSLLGRVIGVFSGCRS